jgi:murein L,D-transpeptidase YafK
LPEIYGYGAFPLNYPNIVDRIYDKTGYGIWIHGTGKTPKLNTEGCIALDNKYIKTFKSKNITGLPVIITENVPFYKRGEYEQYKWGLINYLKQYHDLWQLNDYNNFKNFYHQEFRAGGSQTLKNYLSQKSKLMKLYPYKRILYDNVKIYRENDSEVLFDYNQLYCADNILSEGAKKLYLIREDNSFKIIAEEFTNSKEYSLTKAYILKYIRAWRNAWQNKNIDEYMKFYHKDFTGDGFNYNRWYDDKKDKFAKLRFIKVDISGITVKFIKPTLYRITFIQKFESDKYSDSGIKTIMLSGCISDNKIISEIWRPLKR